MKRVLCGLATLNYIVMAAPSKIAERDIVGNSANESSLIYQRWWNPPSDDNYISIKMFGHVMPVGQFYGQKMWDEVNYAVWALCEKDEPGGSKCERLPKKRKVKHVTYMNDDSKIDKMHSFTIHVEHASWPVFHPKQQRWMRDAMTDMVAYAYRAMTDQKEKCRKYNVDDGSNDGKKGYLCQVGKWVRLDVRSGGYKAMLQIRIQQSKDKIPDPSITIARKESGRSMLRSNSIRAATLRLFWIGRWEAMSGITLALCVKSSSSPMKIRRGMRRPQL